MQTQSPVYFVQSSNHRLWLVIWRALAASLAGVDPQALSFQQFRATVCGWSYEGSVENQHYFKHSACGFSVKTGKCVHGVSGPQSVIIVA